MSATTHVEGKLLSYQYLQMLPPARAGRGEQGLGHPERVHPGAVELGGLAVGANEGRRMPEPPPEVTPGKPAA
jgi:hypothetical protein